MTDVLRVLDSVAKGVQRFEAGIGISAATADSLAEGASNNCDTVLGAIMNGTDASALLLELERRRDLVVAGRLYRGLEGERLAVALDAHLGGTGSLNRALLAANARVHPDLRKIGVQVDARNAFAPAEQVLGAVTVTGSGTGSLAAGTPIDTSLYGPANLVIRTTTLIGAAPIVATLTLQPWEGATVEREVTIPAASPIGTTLDVGTHGTDLFVAVTAVSFTGGTNGDAFHIRSEVERTLVL